MIGVFIPVRECNEAFARPYPHGYVVQENGCWEWTGSTKGKGGYGQIVVGGRTYWAHRWMWERLRGPIPFGFQIDHLCRNPRCIRVEHLELVTGLENLRRGRSVSATTARTGVCQRGHRLDEQNTYVTPDGRQQCRACARMRGQRRRAALRGER